MKLEAIRSNISSLDDMDGSGGNKSKPAALDNK